MHIGIRVDTQMLGVKVKKALLSIEALILVGPMTVLIVTFLPLTFVMGVPVAFNQPAEISKTSLLFYCWVFGVLFGLYAIGYLWKIVWYSISNKKININAWFYFGIAAGVISSGCLLFIFHESLLKAIFFGVIPVAIATFHFLWLQNRLMPNENNT
jgi:hypothetical protein